MLSPELRGIQREPVLTGQAMATCSDGEPLFDGFRKYTLCRHARMEL